MHNKVSIKSKCIKVEKNTIREKFCEKIKTILNPENQLYLYCCSIFISNSAVIPMRSSTMYSSYGDLSYIGYHLIFTSLHTQGIFISQSSF